MEEAAAAHLLGLIGPSGAGKSSFLRAGLLPVMPTGWRAVVSTPGSVPSRAGAEPWPKSLPGTKPPSRTFCSSRTLEVAVSVVSRWRQRHEQALIVVDQFEELFTLNPPETQAALRRASRSARLSRPMLHVLLSMRDDFLFHCHASRRCSRSSRS